MYLYDENGAPFGMQYRNSTMAEGVFVNFYFEKNLFGDIVAVYNESGVKVLSYYYDAWGNHTPTWHNSTGNNAYAQYNPFRYRGYYYDTETEFYYLQSRYFDPVTGRFLNADNYISVNGNLSGYNLFAYCFNNPIKMTDSGGTWPEKEDGSFKGLVIGFIEAAVELIQTTLSSVDATYSVGYNISGTPSGVAFNLQGGLSIDTKGNIALQGTFTEGITTASTPGCSITSYRSITNAPSIYKLEGNSYQIGGSAGAVIEGVPLVAGGDIGIIPDSELNKTYWDVTGSIGFGTPGVEGHVEQGKTGTWRISVINVFDFTYGILTAIKGDEQ